MEDKSLSFVQMFKSFQGEGVLNGQPSLWLRTALCNLQCDGFGQSNPTDPSTYDLPYKKIDVTHVDSYTDLPVFERGCDSSYAWAKEFKKFFKTESVESIIKQLDLMLPEEGIWDCEDYDFDMVFTGGEPLLKKNQSGIAAMIDIWNNRSPVRCPRGITFETNGTQPVIDELAGVLNDSRSQILFSFSPKLFTVSGEKNSKAIKPDVIVSILESVWHCQYQLKFVLSPDPRAWDELESVVDSIGLGRKAVWIMPVGGTVEGLEVSSSKVADIAVDRGYKVAARSHVNLYGNDPDK